MRISIIAALGKGREIGYKNNLLWHISADMKRFRQITTGHPVIMGRLTFESLGNKPLPDRLNIVLSASLGNKYPGVLIARNVEEALIMATGDDEVFILGGAKIYREFLPMASRLYLTLVHRSYKADAFFPLIDNAEWKVLERTDIEFDEHAGVKYSFVTFERIE